MLACALTASVPLSGTVVDQQPQTAPTLSVLTDRAARYASDFEANFSRVLSDERYSQDLKDSGGRVLGRRVLQSEVYFARLDEPNPWITVRNVLRVNGNRIR